MIDYSLDFKNKNKHNLSREDILNILLKGGKYIIGRDEDDFLFIIQDIDNNLYIIEYLKLEKDSKVIIL